jgi:DNA helicase-2/ATP-dependent DNA helicase PcrA
MQEHEDVREQYQRRFQFILVDEYQDTNKLQSDLIDLLAARHQNVMVVGDDAQSIYAWRGANFQNILKFPERYPGAKVYKIETNYRSTPEILNVANAAIAANVEPVRQGTGARAQIRPKPVLVVCNDAAQQAAFVAQRVLELREEGVDLNKMAVLYRSHFHALEAAARTDQAEHPLQHHQRHPVFRAGAHQGRDGVSEAGANPRDELSFKRLAQLLPGIGGKGADKAAAWKQFVETVSQLEDETTRKSAAKMLRIVMDAGYDDYLKENFANYRNRLEDSSNSPCSRINSDRSRNS